MVRSQLVGSCAPLEIGAFDGFLFRVSSQLELDASAPSINGFSSFLE